MTGPSTPTPASLRVVSWNIQYGRAVAQAVREIDADERLRAVDVVLLQEMDGAGTERIAEALGADHVYTSPAPHAHTGRDFGNAVVSRLPIRAGEEIALPHVARVSGQPRSVAHAVIHVGPVDVAVYSVHAEIPLLRLARRIEQFDTVAEHARRCRLGHVVVGGDFNTVTSRGMRAVEASMSAAGLRRVGSTPVATCRRYGRGFTLDHVFVAGFEVAAHGVVPVTAASDHLPLWADLRPVDRVPATGA